MEQIESIVRHFLSRRGIEVFERVDGDGWQFTNDERHFDTPEQAFAAALDHIGELFDEYEQVYIRWTML